MENDFTTIYRSEKLTQFSEELDKLDNAVKSLRELGEAKIAGRNVDNGRFVPQATKGLIQSLFSMATQKGKTEDPSFNISLTVIDDAKTATENLASRVSDLEIKDSLELASLKAKVHSIAESLKQTRSRIDRLNYTGTEKQKIQEHLGHFLASVDIFIELSNAILDQSHPSENKTEPKREKNVSSPPVASSTLPAPAPAAAGSKFVDPEDEDLNAAIRLSMVEEKKPSRVMTEEEQIAWAMKESESEAQRAHEAHSNDALFGQNIAKKHHLQYVKVHDDGNCLLYATLQHLLTHKERFDIFDVNEYRNELFTFIAKNETLKNEVIEDLRNKIIQIGIASKQEDFDDIVSGLPSKVKAALTEIWKTKDITQFNAKADLYIKGNALSDYLEGMKNSTSYCGLVELHAIALKEKMQIIMYSDTFANPIILTPNVANTSPLHVVYFARSRHFDLLATPT
jgi:hypothetical protein